jgi:hypothetical protein
MTQRCGLFKNESTVCKLAKVIMCFFSFLQNKRQWGNAKVVSSSTERKDVDDQLDWIGGPLANIWFVLRNPETRIYDDDDCHWRFEVKWTSNQTNRDIRFVLKPNTKKCSKFLSSIRTVPRRACVGFFCDFKVIITLMLSRKKPVVTK